MKYPRWKAISEIPDVNFREALLTIDQETDFGRFVVSRFPEYFSDTEVLPMPFSVLMERAECSDAWLEGEFASENLYYCDVIPESWPVLKFGDSRSVDKRPGYFKLIPDELKHAREIGRVYRWKGERMVLIGKDFRVRKEWFFVSEKFIDVNE
ncbi:hypothetical protein ACFL08_04110 [Patescibacteria group bacterium]